MMKFSFITYREIDKINKTGQSPTQSCRSLPNHTGFFKSLEKWERIENGLNKRFCYRDRRTEKKAPPRAKLL